MLRNIDLSFLYYSPGFVFMGEGRYRLSGSMILAFIHAHLLYRSRSVAVAFVYGESRASEGNHFVGSGKKVGRQL